MVDRSHSEQSGIPARDVENRAAETQQRILQAAFEVFSEHGYARSTTVSLAAAAGINELTLFRHFGNKKKLFSAVVEKFGGAAVAGELEAEITGDYAKDMRAIGKRLNQIMFERERYMRLAISEADHFPETKEVMAQNPHQIRQMLSKYFQKQIERRQVRELNPGAMAQAFMGMFLTYMITQCVFNDPVEPEIQTDDVVAHFVDIFVEGTVRRG